MNIQGFGKLTLLDFPGKLACTVFTGGCNFRCPFCHNSSLVLSPTENTPYTEAEIFAFLKKRSGILDGVAVTGGEPLLQSDLESFLAKVKAMGYSVKLDTNGSFPEKLARILENGLADYVAVDIKNSPKRYAETCGTEKADLEAVKKSIELLMNSDVDYEFRTTVVKQFHTISDIESAARMIKGAKRYFLQAFKDSGTLIDESCSGVSEEELKAMRDAAAVYVPETEIRGI